MYFSNLESRYNNSSDSSNRNKASARWTKACSHSLTFSILFGFLPIDSLIEFTIVQFSSLNPNPYGMIRFIPAHIFAKKQYNWQLRFSITVNGVSFVQTNLLVGSIYRIHTLTELYEFNYCVNNTENATLDSLFNQCSLCKMEIH